ncbi:hypothetical protein [Microlunatus flavus]|uniref:hypothetical protein n=1 Tax=Microlunatus flavus TaxID=1036181 RepID=UPI000B86D9BB|nr:hypothetical protein [Microlunatus flavus]
MGIVLAVVAELTARGIPDVLAHRRWIDPEPGGSVVVVRSDSTWTYGSTSAEFPTVAALIYSAPSASQDDAETVGEPVAADVRAVLHRVQGGAVTWSGQRVLSSQHVGASLAQPEGHPDWRVRVLTFEVQTG